MGYSTNPTLVEERRALLAQLEDGKTCKWIVKGGWSDTKRIAYKIREGLYIAALHPRQFPKLASAAKRFSIHVPAKGVIEARLRPVGTVETTSFLDMAAESPIIDQPLGRDVPNVKLSTADEVIEAWQARGPSSDPMRLIATVLPNTELLKLWHWATSHTPRLMLIVGDHNQTLTVSLHDMSMREYAYNPETRKKEEQPPRQSWQPPKPPKPKETFDL